MCSQLYHGLNDQHSANYISAAKGIHTETAAHSFIAIHRPPSVASYPQSTPLKLVYVTYEAGMHCAKGNVYFDGKDLKTAMSRHDIGGLTKMKRLFKNLGATSNNEEFVIPELNAIPVALYLLYGSLFTVTTVDIAVFASYIENINAAAIPEAFRDKDIIVLPSVLSFNLAHKTAEQWYSLVRQFEQKFRNVHVFPLVEVECHMELKNDYIYHLAHPLRQYIPGNFDGEQQTLYESHIQFGVYKQPTLFFSNPGLVEPDLAFHLDPSNTILAPTIILNVDVWNFGSPRILQIVSAACEALMIQSEQQEWQVDPHAIVMKGCNGTRAGSLAVLKVPISAISLSKSRQIAALAKMVCEKAMQWATGGMNANVGDEIEQVRLCVKRKGYYI